ncbi:MAG: hypothetical protein QOG44_717 [Acidimicrobiaceae bacterium]|nr:hypothetical protein [Acidimicrobiaceae bacterium]
MLYPLSYEGWIPGHTAGHVRCLTRLRHGTRRPGEILTKLPGCLQGIRPVVTHTRLMLTFRWHHRRTPERPIEATEPDVAQPADGVPVLLSPGLVDLAGPLSAALGPGFAVETEGLGWSGVMIVGPVGPPGVSFLRISHPGVVLLVVDRRGYGPRSIEAVAHLDAGADGYLASPPVAEVASHVQALVRRASANAA